YCLLPTAYCLLPTAYCLLPTAYCLLLKNSSCTNLPSQVYACPSNVDDPVMRAAGAVCAGKYRDTPGHQARKEGDVFVACSTLCFGKYSLDQAVRIIGELRFAKVDLAVHEELHHLKPTEVAADVSRISHRLKSICPLGLAAFHVHIAATEAEEHDRQLRAVCRL